MMKIGIIGIGLMGQAFVERYLAQGYSVSIYNRHQENIKHLNKPGITICQSAEELIYLSDTIILMLSDADAIVSVLNITPAENSRQPDLPGKTVLQMATISPKQSKMLEVAIISRGGNYLEAPVLGSLPEAANGTLIIMTGGSEDVFKSTLPVLKILGAHPQYIGRTGSASALKLAMNQLIASLTAGFSLSLGYALSNGVDSELFMKTVRESALYAKTYDKKLQKYLECDFDAANFTTRHLLKDIRLFIDDATDLGLNTDALEGIEKITARTVDNDMSLMDYSSIYETICPKQ